MIIEKKSKKMNYKIPEWCSLSIKSHFDGVGGCWGISEGYIIRKGENYCIQCEYHKSKNISNKQIIELQEFIIFFQEKL